MSAIPPGWFDDGHGALRWWDGAAWTEHVAEPAPELLETPPAEAHTSGGAFTAATDGKKSSLWVIWVVIGVLLLAVVVAVAVIIPVVALRSTVDAVSGASADDAVETSAARVVDEFEASWVSADCDAFFLSTTDDFRAAAGLNSCGDFAAQAELVDRAVDDYVYTITEVVHEGDTVTIEAEVSFVNLYDNQGRELIEPEPVSYTAQYVLVPAGEDWAIDELN